MPADVAEMVATVRRHNPDWIHVVIGDDDLKALGLSADRLRAEFGTWAAASNFVRLLVLQKVGGVYLDVDCECLKPLDPLLAMSDCLAAEQDGGRICNAVMGATPNHPWINWQLAHMGDFDRKDAASGVYLASAAPRELVTIIPQRLVYPWLWTDAPEKRVPHAESILEHRWAGSWVQKPKDIT